uniref:Uncharacterized protein n=1 Tax=Mizugakiibacter sediminis TaxID=1475481 RepID=A0A0S6YXD8_9GAMM
MQARIEAEQVGKARGEAEHGDAVVAGGVQRDHRVGVEAGVRGDVFQIRAEVAAVADRDFDRARRRGPGRRFGAAGERIQHGAHAPFHR